MSFFFVCLRGSSFWFRLVVAYHEPYSSSYLLCSSSRRARARCGACRHFDFFGFTANVRLHLIGTQRFDGRALQIEFDILVEKNDCSFNWNFIGID